MPDSVHSSNSVILPPPVPAQETAPFFGTWRRAYAAVVIGFFAQVAILWALTRGFS